MREHQEACRKGTFETSAVAEHAWKNHHTIRWEETTVVNMARHPNELLLKEAIHINMTPVRNASTETQDLSSLDAGWLYLEKTGKQDGSSTNPANSGDS